MSLSSHAGKDTFTIAGKTINKRAGTSNIYDIAGGASGGGVTAEQLQSLEDTITALQSQVDSMADISIYHNYRGGSSGYRVKVQNAPYSDSQGNTGTRSIDIDDSGVDYQSFS